MLFKIGFFFVKAYISLIGLAVIVVLIILVLAGGLLIFPRRKQEYGQQKESDMQKEIAEQEKNARQTRICEINKDLDIARQTLSTRSYTRRVGKFLLRPRKIVETGLVGPGPTRGSPDAMADEMTTELY